MEQFFLYIIFTKNNIITTLVKKKLGLKKDTICTVKTTSSGVWNFKHKQKKTPFSCIFILKKIFITKPIHVIFKGESFFRYLILYLLKQENITVLSISEKTTIPHNGCKYSYKNIQSK